MDQVFDFFRDLLGTDDWPPRWICGEWSDFHGWLYILSDLTIWLAYLGIPMFLLAFVHKKKDVPLPPVFWLFGAFIALCGLTHLMDALIFWWPAYRLSAFIRFITAIISIITVIALFRFFPKALTLKTSRDLEKELNQRKDAEERLRKAHVKLEANNRKLRVKNEEVQQLASMVSHDLKEPLQSFSSVLDLLKKHTDDFEEVDPREYINYLEESSERMHTLITDLLDYARLGNKRELSEVNLEEVVGQVRDDLKSHIEQKGAQVTSGSLPVLQAYKTELRMLFQNLINNALKFSKPDVAPIIQVTAEERKDDWLFVVHDNGKGISKEDQKKIFMIFETIENQEIRESTGIGLAHCKKIVEMHEGQIWVQSEIGVGSAFHFTISKKLSPA